MVYCITEVLVGGMVRLCCAKMPSLKQARWSVRGQAMGVEKVITDPLFVCGNKVIPAIRVNAPVIMEDRPFAQVRSCARVVKNMGGWNKLLAIQVEQGYLAIILTFKNIVVCVEKDGHAHS